MWMQLWTILSFSYNLFHILKLHGPSPFITQSQLKWPWERVLLKLLWEKEKVLVTSIFSFSHNVFYPIKDKFHHLSHMWICVILIGSHCPFVVTFGKALYGGRGILHVVKSLRLSFVLKFVCLEFYTKSIVFPLFNCNSLQIHVSWTIFNQYLTSPLSWHWLASHLVLFS